jgi:hypothetical protein
MNITAARVAARKFFLANGATAVRTVPGVRRNIIEVHIPAETLIELIPAIRRQAFRFVVTHSDIALGIFRAEV